MLDILTDGFKEAKLKFRGKTVLSEDLIDQAMIPIRQSLLEADVEYGVTKTFLKRVKEEALGQEVKLKAGAGAQKMRVSPEDHFVRICSEQLVELMGPVDTSLPLARNRPGSIMMVGLQGSGKTTSTGKLARYLQQELGRKPLLVAADIYRPAAVEQLRVLGERLEMPVFHLEGAKPPEICQKALDKAYELDRDVILYDTAGRLTIDEALMQELTDIKTKVKPDQILLVCDAMMGQDAVTTAKAFEDKLSLSGVIMTKLDGDARGGAALSVKEVTGKPIKFLGMGESLEQLEEFRPEGLASRILGMGDVESLMKDFQRVADDDLEKDAERILQGQFTYDDFLKQIQMIQKMGSMKDILAKLPMQDMIPQGADIDDSELTRVQAMINSMTKRERKGLDPLDPSRMERVAKGSGRQVKEVKDLAQKFQGMRKMMGTFGKNMGGLMGKIPGMGSLSQLNQIRKMAGSMGDLSQMAGMFGGAPGMAPKRPVDRDKQRKLRKAAKKARKKNRKK